MTAYGDMSAAGLRVLGLLTAPEVAMLLTRALGVRYSAARVHRLADEGVLERVRFGALARFTPESVAAYKATMTATGRTA